MSAVSSAAPTTQELVGVRPFGWRDRIGYMLGDVGNNLTFFLQSAFFLIFYTNVMGISPGHVGTLLFGARILDAFTDIGAGRLIDTLRPGRSGRFRPWLLRFMVPVAVATVLMFSPILQDGSYAARLTWMVVTYILWGAVCYTLVNIPYGSMVSVISTRPGQRASLSVFRSLGGYLGFLGLAGLLPLFVYVQVDGSSEISGSRMMLAAIVCGVLAIACYTLCFLGVRERVRTPPTPRGERAGPRTLFLALVSNRALTGIIAASLCMLIAMTLLASMLPYVYNEVFDRGQLLSLANIVGLVPVLAFLPFAAALARRFGKREIGVLGMTLATLAGLVLLGVRTDSPYVFTVGYAVLMLGYAAMESLIWAVISDVIDVQEIRTGERNDATIYALHSWSRKIGQAVAGGLSGWTLGWIGYEAALGQGAEQSPSVLGGIYALATGVPAVLLGAAGLILALWYPLSKKRVQGNVALLEERRAATHRTRTP